MMAYVAKAYYIIFCRSPATQSVTQCLKENKKTVRKTPAILPAIHMIFSINAQWAVTH